MNSAPFRHLTGLRVFFVALLIFLGMYDSAFTQVTITQQLSHYDRNNNNASSGGVYDNGTTEVGMWMNGDNQSQGLVAWKNFRVGSATSNTQRSLQVGDTFQVTLSTRGVFYGTIGASLNTGNTFTGGTFGNRLDGSRIAIIQNGGNFGSGGGRGAWYVAGATSPNFGITPNSVRQDYSLYFTITSHNTANVRVTGNGGDTTLYDIGLNGTAGANISNYSIWLSDDRSLAWNDNSGGRGDTYWKQTTSVTAGGAAVFGGDNGTRTISGRIANGLSANSASTENANKVFKIGTGTVTLSDSGNTYSGGTEIQVGTLAISADGNLGAVPGSATAGSITIWSTGTLQTTATMTLNSNRGISLGTVNGPAISVTSGTLTYGGIMTGSALWSKRGTGTLRLTSAAGENTGIVYIEGGTLQVTADRALGAVPGSAGERINIWSTGTFEADGTFTLDSNRRIVLGTVTGPKISVTSGNTLTYGGQISGSAGWSKETAGTLILSGTSTANGTATVAGGTLLVSGSMSSAAVSVSSGATLAGAGTVGGLTINGAVSPGNTANSRATLNASTIALGAGGSYNFDIANVTGTAGTEWDRVLGSGAITVNSTGTFTINLTGNPTGFSAGSSYAWTIMSGSSISGFNAARFAVNTTGFTPSFTGGTFSVAQSGNNIQLVYTPPAAPTLTTSAAASIAATSATLGGNVSADGGASVTDRGVVYKTSAGVTISDNKTGIGTGTGAFSQSISSLSVNTQYFFRAYAINTGGTSLGSELNFWTLANVPTAPSLSAATTGGFSVQINANSNPSTTQFAIRTAGQYVQANGTLGASAAWQTASTWGTVAVTGLSSSTQYTVDVQARNGANTETAFGAPANITTSAPSGTFSTSGSLSAMSTTYGTASTAQTFTVTGSNLTGALTVTAPTGFEVSTTSSTTGFGATATLTPSSGSLSAASVWVRLAARSAVASSPFSGNVTISGGGATTQTVATASSSMSAKALTVTGLTGVTKVYNRSTAATATGTAALSGVESGDTVTLGGTPVFTFASANVGTGVSISTSGYTIGGASAGNYSLTQPTLSANITQKELTITGLTGVTKVYNRSTAATATGTAALSGVESGDTVTLSGTPTFTFASANVGTGISISTSGYTIGGANAGNYSLTQPTLSANITQKPLTISGATATNRDYNALTTVTVSGGALVGVESGDTVTLGGSPAGTVTSATVGTGKAVTVTGYSISGASSGNYSLTQPTDVTVNITKATPSVTVNPTATTILYAEALSASTLSGGTVSPSGGSWAWTTPATIPAPGTATYSATYTPTDTTNYNNATANVSVTSTMAQARNKNGAASPAQPSGIFLGDKDLTFEVETWGQIGDNWGQPRLYIRHDNSDVTGGSSTAYGSFTNSNLKTVSNSPQFTNTGTWYWAIRMNYSAPYGSDFWYKSSNAGWTAMSTNGVGSTLTVTVSALNNPTVSATVASATQINLTHTRADGKSVLIVRRQGSAVTWSPTQGTAYTDNQNVGDGHTVLKGSWGADSFNDTGLLAGTTYHYKIYSENYDYYSSGATASGTTPGNYTYDVTSGTTTESANLGGSGTLTKTGAGELLLTGINTYTGTTTINGGILRINADSGLGTAPSSPLSNSITIGTAILALDGAITLNANRGITLTGTATIDDWGNNDTYNGIIATESGATTSLTKIGGGILTLGGNNTYTGGTTVNNGAVQLTHANALGATGVGNGTTVNTGNALRLSGGIAVGNEPLTLNGVGVSGLGGALRNVSQNNSWAGAITLGSNTRIDSDSGTLTLSGAISGGSNVLFIGDAGNIVINGAISGAGATQDSTTTSLYKSGTGTNTLGVANSYTGDTRISSGVLVANAAGALGNGSDIRIALNGSLVVSNSVTVASIREWGTTNGGTATIASGATLTVNGANKGEHFQNSISGAGGLTMSGSGTTRLSLYGTQSYTGTTTVNSGAISTPVAMGTTNLVINGGTFFIASGGNINSADITVGSNGTLNIAGTTSERALAASKVLTASATGANTTGTITVDTDSDFSLGSGSLNFSAYGGGATAPLTVSGTGGNLNLNSRAVSVSSTTQLAAGTYKLIAKSGSANVTGTPGALTMAGSGLAANTSGALSVSNGELILTVTVNVSAPVVTGATFSGTVGTSFSQSVSASNSPTSYAVASGTLPAGLTLNTSTGAITGTPTAAASGTTVSISATNAGGTGSASFTFNIAKGTPSITAAPTASAITFGQTLASSTLTGGSASVAGGFAFTTSSTAPNAGTAAQSVTFTPADTANYNTTTTTVNVTVNAASLPTVTFTAPASLTYDRTAKTYTASATGPSSLTLTYTGRNSTTYNSTTAPTNVGDYTVTATTSDGNYTGSQAQNFSITQKGLTISGASATSRAYNATTTVAVSGGSLVGVESGDTVTLGGSPTGTVTSANVGTGKAVTVTGYSISGASSSNYNLTQPTGLTADITAKALTITAPTIASKVYDGTATAGAVTVGTLSGLVGSETVTATATAANYSSANVGSYPGVVVTYSLADGTNGGLASNYSLAAGSATGVITAASLASNQITLSSTNGTTYTVSGPGGSTFDITYSGRTVGTLTNTYSSTLAPTGAGYYRVTADATGNYSGSKSEDYYISGPVAVADRISRTTPTMNIPRATLLQNDVRIDNSGAIQTNNLSITAVATGTGTPTVGFHGTALVSFTPGGSGTETFTYTLSDGTSTATGTATVLPIAWDTVFAFARMTVAPVFDGFYTEATVTFNGVPNVTYTIRYKGELSQTWRTIGGVYSENGTFEVLIQEEGDHVTDWTSSMYFEAQR